MCLKPNGHDDEFLFASLRPKTKKNGWQQVIGQMEKKWKQNFMYIPSRLLPGLWTNPTDLAKYIIETQLALQGKSEKVLTQEVTMLRLTPYIDSNAALGVFITKKNKERYFGHNGADEGFLSAYTGSFENGKGVVVMVNSDNGAILEEVINSVATVYGWKDFYKPIRKKVVAISDALFNSYAGNYLLDKDTINISRKNNEYLLMVNNRQRFPIHFSSDTEFFSKQLPLEFKFEKDDKGKVKDFYFKEGSEELRAKRL
jgi:hypothetical protein